jgi:hypothetical protein
MNCMLILAGANCFCRWGFALTVLIAAASVAGCVERRMTVRSNPPGAQVYVDDYELGTAPVSHGYTYYGTRKIRLVKDGYETLTVYQPMPPPWYDWPGIDFFSENLWPHKIRDERSFEYQMQPIVSVPTDELRARAEQLRSASQVVPAGAAQPIGAPPPGVQSAIVQPQELPPPVLTGPPTVPQNAAGAPATVPAPVYSTAPPLNTLAPPGNFTPQGGYPAQSYPGTMPAPGASPSPSTVPLPNYGPPGGAPSNTPSNVPPFGQPVVPPDWRPIGETPTPLQR